MSVKLTLSTNGHMTQSNALPPYKGKVLAALLEYYDKVFKKPVKASSYFLAGSDMPQDMVEFQNAPLD